MIIYADELLLKNFIMTYLILIVVGEILEIRYKKKNLILGSISVSFITLIANIYEVDNNILIRFIAISLLVFIGFKPKEPKNYFIDITFIFLITFLLGGVMKSNINNLFETVLYGVISVLALKKYSDYYKLRKWKIRNLYKIKFELENKKIELNAFLDTGNFLKTNFENDSIIVISKNILKDKISNRLYMLLSKGETNDLPFYILKNIRTINYYVLNTELKTMYGLKVKNVHIESENLKCICDAVIVLSKNDMKEIEALIGISLLEGGIENGNNANVKAKSKEIVC